jgi:predicted nucleotidyltransferase
MKTVNLEGLNPVVSDRIRPFIEDILKEYAENIHSIHIVGSAVTPDFKEKSSDINTVIILNKMSFDFIKFLAPLGKKYGKKKIAAPLIMTEEYIQNSLDVFPIEFHDFRLIHRTVVGEDILDSLKINKSNLRLQCEREIKARLVGIRQNYISSLGDKKYLLGILSQSIVGCMPVIRAIVYLLGQEPPIKRHDAVRKFQELTSIEADILEKILAIRANVIKPSGEDIHHIFEQYYSVLERIGNFIDEHQL